MGRYELALGREQSEPTPVKGVQGEAFLIGLDGSGPFQKINGRSNASGATGIHMPFPTLGEAVWVQNLIRSGRLKPCPVCNSAVEGFINESYYHMFTVRCNTCQTEKDYNTRAEALARWNGDFE